MVFSMRNMALMAMTLVSALAATKSCTTDTCERLNDEVSLLQETQILRHAQVANKPTESSFKVGEKVFHRDRGEFWRVGFVTSTDPLLVDGLQWDEVEKMGVSKGQSMKEKIKKLDEENAQLKKLNKGLQGHVAGVEAENAKLKEASQGSSPIGEIAKVAAVAAPFGEIAQAAATAGGEMLKGIVKEAQQGTIEKLQGHVASVKGKNEELKKANNALKKKVKKDQANTVKWRGDALKWHRDALKHNGVQVKKAVVQAVEKVAQEAKAVKTAAKDDVSKNDDFVKSVKQADASVINTLKAEVATAEQAKEDAEQEEAAKVQETTQSLRTEVDKVKEQQAMQNVAASVEAASGKTNVIVAKSDETTPRVEVGSQAKSAGIRSSVKSTIEKTSWGTAEKEEESTNGQAKEKAKKTKGKAKAKGKLGKRFGGKLKISPGISHKDLVKGGALKRKAKARAKAKGKGLGPAIKSREVKGLPLMTKNQIDKIGME
jgi:hypothetical protein